MRTATVVSKRWLILALTLGMLGLPAIIGTPAQGIEPGLTAIDDFEDGDSSDWTFFGGSEAGGGGGVLADRPYEGSNYFSTGWGGRGTISGFYGGAFKNFVDAEQVTPPANPWFNVWVLNQSDATVDSYQLEITIREDLDGNGWSDGPEESFRLDTSFASSSFDDTWTLISAPLSGFTPVAGSGDGTFNGNLDEIVIVVAGVVGGDPSAVEVDFDQFAFSDGPLAPEVIDDFESGLPSGAAVPDGEPLGFYTFQGDGSVAISTATTPPAPVLPAVGDTNNVLQMDVDVSSFAGYIHAFENPTVDAWVTKDWSTREGISFWMYGLNSGTQMFIDILDNRNPGSTVDDAERFTVAFVDDFTGWQLLEFPFASFVRKEIGNGAPNDGLGLFAMHGYALGTLGTGGPRTFYFDEVSVYGIAEPPALAANFSQQNTFVEEGTTGMVGVKLNRPMGPDDPAQVSIDYATERSNAVPGEEFTPTSGTLTFVNGGPSELFFEVVTFDDTKFEGDEQIVIRLTNPVDMERGALFQGSVLIDDNDDFDADLLDDFEQGAFLWDTDGFVELDAMRVELGDPYERPGQDAVENIGAAAIPRSGDGFDVATEAVIADLEALLPAGSWWDNWLIGYAVRQLDRSLNPVARENGFFLDHKRGGSVFWRTALAVASLERVARRSVAEAAPAQDAIDALVAIDAQLAVDAIDVADFNGGSAYRIDRANRQLTYAKADLDRGREAKAILHYRSAWKYAKRAIEKVQDPSLASLVRDFPLGQDWTDTQSLDFWFHGTGSGEPITLTLKDNRAPDPGPDGWTLAWADEFNESAGTPPNPANWVYEIGDTTPDGKNGWGNEELQYYTDDPANAQTDGNGNLVITLTEADGSQECYYGPCEFESARLLTQNRAEFAYGRIESRLQVPTGGDGLWPAFWSLGTDITYNPWPAAGEIDFMEYVSRIPNEIFGTIHGPGYNGGGSFGGIYDFGERVDLEYHTFVTEWEPNLITWYVDGIQYHQAEPADVPGPWVFEKPFFLLLNFAIGGNFGGAIDPANTYPQEYLVDYVRVYQGPDTAERFETTFTDSVAGWQQISIPITDFVRSADQPAGAPDDGLTLTDVWGYGLDVPYPAAGEYKVDFVQRTPIPPPTELTVTNLDDSGPGSLREALSLIAEDGTITFDPSLAGGTLTLTTGQLTIDRSVTVDASAAAPVTISAGGASRVLQVNAGTTVALSDLVIRDGVAAPQGGGILNYGSLSLDQVVVTNNTENSAGTSFDLGGGGIYNGDGATLNLTDSTVSDNATVAQPGGGVYGFFNSTITVTNSTISGNVGGDVAGGLRTLGNLTVTNSTISGNTSTAWHGGALFATDGVVSITNSTIVGNNAPGGTAGGLMVATFGAPVDVTIADNVIADNGTYNCQLEGGGAAVLTSLGGNVVTDGSCAPDAADQVVAAGGAGVDVLADNGGPTLTHALLAGSVAIDAAVGACPATDQRGIARDASCDVGSYEFIP
ncbi:MAG: carbohydrate binding domain-containing protein [Acidimicrobiia bacterium]|nr:carbohydrate binding domain-containing protein [Acidimicrobiia bacterium]